MKGMIILLVLIYFAPGDLFATNFEITGFKEYLIKKGDCLSKIVPPSQWEIVMKVNKIDEKHLIPGKKILIPVNEKAKEFCPVPKKINDDGERVVVFFLDIQYFGAYEKGKLILWGPISSGKRNSTPQGKFYVRWKSKNYFSRKYKREMPYAVNFFKGYFFHQQALPGYPASHGCIRLLHQDAKKLFYWIKIGDPVIITTLENFH
ncbi:L,D-transpeptidase family protein [bacterium]|nr:L,D-transpeptidase family protein [bacterium]